MKSKAIWITTITCLVLITLVLKCVYEANQILNELIAEEVPHSELIINYQKNRDGFKELTKFYKTLKPFDFLRFEKNNTITMRISDTSSNKVDFIINLYESSKNNPEVTKALNYLKWTKNDLKKIEKLLKMINCFSIQVHPKDFSNPNNFYPLEIAYKRSGTGTVYYKVFDKSFDSSKVAFFQEHLIKKKKGGILNNHIIWYYR